MGKYKNLLANTLLFGISTFGSKILTLLLASVYTRVLKPGETSTSDLIVVTCNLILPVMYLGINEAVIRFGLDDDAGRKDIFSVGILTALTGFGITLALYPALRQIPYIANYMPLFYLYILNSALRNIITHFVRASGLRRIFALDGIITTVTTLGFNLLYLLVFKLGAPGLVLATATADAVSVLGLFFLLRLHRFIRFRGIDRDLIKAMFRYSIPLIPTAVFWWITNSSDRFMIRYFCGDEANGLYGQSSHLPAIITTVSAIFTQAWQISAFTEGKGKEGAKFFSSVFKSYYTFIFLAASGLILLVRPIISVWLGEGFYESWQYVPFLVLAVSFSCLVTFLGTVYNVVKKNIMITATTFLGAVINFVLNLLFIPRMGPQGAALATFISFLAVFLIRAVDSRRYIDVKMQPLRIALNLGLLLLQVRISLTQPPHGMLFQTGILLLLVAANFGHILFLLRRLLELLAARKRA